MRTSELIKELNNLPPQERIFVIERAIHSFRQKGENEELKKASELLFDDYKNDKELTAFTALDFEEFYETRWNMVDKSWANLGSRN